MSVKIKQVFEKLEVRELSHTYMIETVEKKTVEVIDIISGVPGKLRLETKGDLKARVGKTNEYSESYARLFATAPELLEAARCALEIAENWIHDELDGTGILLQNALDKLKPVRATIRKAEGK